MIYYGNISLCSEEDLAHHGIKGQKWGVRRFQNEDGSLTEAGQARYGNKKDYSEKDDGLIRTGAKSSLYGRGHLREWRKNRLANKIADTESAIERNRQLKPKDEIDGVLTGATEGMLRRKQANLQAKLDAQKASDANRKAYEDHTSTKKLVAQDVFMTKFGSDNYRHARARGSGRVRSLLEGGAGLEPIGTILRYMGDKKAYGRVAWAGMEDGSTF